jgi:plastocyanin
MSRPVTLLAALALVVPAAAAAQDTRATVIAVQLSEFRYGPAEIDLVHGQPYVLRITNVGKRAHDLSAKAFFATVTLNPASKASVQDGAVEVVSGETADVAFIAQTPGTFEMHCTHPLHAMLGMTGKIVVR